jgi:hypothetical protein
MESKTFRQLEQLGIISMFKHDDNLRVITKNGYVWQYNPDNRTFIFLYEL